MEHFGEIYCSSRLLFENLRWYCSSHYDLFISHMATLVLFSLDPEVSKLYLAIPDFAFFRFKDWHYVSKHSLDFLHNFPLI